MGLEKEAFPFCFFVKDRFKVRQMIFISSSHYAVGLMVRLNLLEFCKFNPEFAFFSVTS